MMKELEKLLNRITQRVNINLRELDFDVKPYVSSLVASDQMTKFYAFYGITPDHPLSLDFQHSALAGSYFLGTCHLNNSVLYKSDVRGDELKKKGETFCCQSFEIPMTGDEKIEIEDSVLIKNLVHCFSHDPETPEKFFIRDTVSTHFANIHGAPSEGCFFGPFSTVDLTTMRDCVIGAYSYIQAGEVHHLNAAPGTILVRSPGNFEFTYQYPAEELAKYISFTPGQKPTGLLMDFIREHKEAFEQIFKVVNIEHDVDVPDNASLDRYAVIRPVTKISENVLVSQRAFLENSSLGKGANAQENCFIINSNLKGYNVTAHGAKIIEADMGENGFVGFNSFLRGRQDARLTVGPGTIIMPHTIMDIQKPLTVPGEHLVWGLVRDEKDLETNSISIQEFSKIDGELSKGSMKFEGRAATFVTAFKDRIHHILEANGAFFDGKNNRGHAQKNQKISFNTIQPYLKGDCMGLYPHISIQP